MSDDRTCRLCLSTEGAMEEIFASPEAELSKKIFECTSVEVKNLVGLPALICEICKSELIIWMKFRRQCLKSNEILKAKFPALFAELQIEQSEAGGSKRHEFEEMSEGDEESRQDDPDYQDEPEDDEDVPLLRFKVERTNDFESEELQQTEDESLGVSERTITMQIEPQDGNERNTGKRRMTRNFTEEMPRMKRKSSGRGEAFVLLDHIGAKDMQLPENRKESDRFRLDPKPPDGLANYNGSQKVPVVPEQNCNCNAKLVEMLKDFHQANNEMFQHLTEEIGNLRREVLSMRSSTADNYQPSILPLVPFENIDDFLKFELKIQEDQEKFNELENTLSQQRKYSEPAKFVKEGIKIFFEDKLAEQFTWRGTSEKRNVRDLHCTMALRHAFRRRYPNTNEEVFDRTLIKHFQYAKDRTVKKLRYNKLDAEKFLKCPRKSKSPSNMAETEIN